MIEILKFDEAMTVVSLTTQRNSAQLICVTNTLEEDLENCYDFKMYT